MTVWANKVEKRRKMENKPIMEEKRKELAKYIPEANTYLEIGCGVTKAMREYIDGDLLQTDIEPEFEPDRIVDVRNQPFGDSEFEVLFCKNVLQHLGEDWKKAVSEMCRVASEYVVTMTRCIDRETEKREKDIPMWRLNREEVSEEFQEHVNKVEKRISEVDDRLTIFSVEI